MNAEIISALESVTPEAIGRIAEMLADRVAVGGRIFLAGNGGSSCIAQHLASDLMKCVGDQKTKSCQVINLSDNTALTTAISNDINYDSVFVTQLQFQEVTEKDAIIFFSVSGNSGNIERCLPFARKRRMAVVAIAGTEPFMMNNHWEFLTVKTELDKKSPMHYYACESVFSCIAHMIANEFHILRGNYGGPTATSVEGEGNA